MKVALRLMKQEAAKKSKIRTFGHGVKVLVVLPVIDYVVIFSHSWKDHMMHLAELFERLWKEKLAINLAKTEFAKAEVMFLGHNTGHGKMTLRNVKLRAIEEFLRPSSKKEGRPVPSTDTLIRLTKLILTLNNFSFNSSHFLQ
eukprot:g32560.t1